MNLKIAFWNIGKFLSLGKEQLLEKAVSSLNPDIFGIAEGTHSIDNCNKMTAVFNKLGYLEYYTPLFVKRIELNLEYPYDRNGLKIFVKKGAAFTFEDFGFEDQKEQGRIIRIKVRWDYKVAVIIFFHNLSKGGSDDWTLDQTTYIRSLADMIRYGVKPSVEDPDVPTAKDRIFILGDFNLEPWEQPLRHPDYLLTSFFRSHNLVDQRKNDNLYFFNPLVELIHSTTKPNLLGTYLNGGTKALFDYILYPTGNANVKFDVITDFGPGYALLDSDVTLVKDFLLHELDHLPIFATIE
jgi:hypothetical protein